MATEGPTAREGNDYIRKSTDRESSTIKLQCNRSGEEPNAPAPESSVESAPDASDSRRDPQWVIAVLPQRKRRVLR